MMNDRAGKMDPSPLSMLSAQSLPIKDLQSQSASISVQFPGMTRQQFCSYLAPRSPKKTGIYFVS